MSNDSTSVVQRVCDAYGNDATRMMDIVRDIQKELGAIQGEIVDQIAAAITTPRVEVASLVSFYTFLTDKPKGSIVIRLCDDIIDEMQGMKRVAKAFSESLGIPVGGTTPDGKITLEYTPCIGLSDQAPAALVNDVPVTRLDAERARDLAEALKTEGMDARLVKTLGDGQNASPLVRSMVVNNIRKPGPVVFSDYESGTGIKNAAAMSPAEVIRHVKTSRLRGRGGAGFPAGMKWDFTRQSEGDVRYVICNADEGEPGTFKDRVLLTECPDLVFEGMAIAGYAIGATQGIVYLRGEYEYLRAYLEDALQKRRDAGLLGAGIAGKDGFDFDIRIQMGAGAYVCGEETALISSCEGLRGDPKNRPPFPAQKGYLGKPTTVNNVETFCCVARILDKGPGWFVQMGSEGSAGTKVLSVSGDCSRPGIYEVEFGITVRELLAMVGAEDAKALQIGGPSGQLIGEALFERTICYDDLATGGSIMVFGPDSDILHIVRKFLEFFEDESCGYCTPCRVGNVLMKNKIDDFIAGNAGPEDIDYLKGLGKTMKLASRCGLGQTSPNPVMSSIQNFRADYDAKMKSGEGTFLPTFNIIDALQVGQDLVGRKSEIYTN